ncbi:hypothetical protein AGMMS49525_11980 [Bacteroidia bacterium]|nr:hypothetical protein AGMMS49525_11980 [Bacteroidia bacterium]
MEIRFTESKKGQIQDIQRKFKSQLSESAIKKGTATAINGVMKSSIGRINKAIKKEYNITPKHLNRISKVSPQAKEGALDAGITVNSQRIPLIGFKPKQSGSCISVQIKKGKKVLVRDSFIATMNSGHTGVYARGRYANKRADGFTYEKGKTKNGKIRISEIKTMSPFSMALTKSVADDVQTYMSSEVTKRVHGLLQHKIDKVVK